MAELIVPKIDEENYEAFRVLLGNGMPATYADWLRNRSDEVARNKSLGHSTREVAIYPDEVTKFRAGPFARCRPNEEP